MVAVFMSSVLFPERLASCLAPMDPLSLHVVRPRHSASRLSLPPTKRK